VFIFDQGKSWAIVFIKSLVRPLVLWLAGKFIGGLVNKAKKHTTRLSRVIEKMRKSGLKVEETEGSFGFVGGVPPRKK